MNGPLYQYLEQDHERIEQYLNSAVKNADAVDMEAYAQFRTGLARHIGIEERLLFPPMLRMLGGQITPVMAQIKLDHGALVALLVPPPYPKIIAAIRAILSKHNILEEENGGVYQIIEQLSAAELAVLLESARSAPDVRMLPHKENPELLEATSRALARAGYSLDEY